ncbi:hypothetical protein EVAR_56884_1 [Eumeta japonica]|uniref:Uncharacterized protein n=1 Tax=Eumeta variegata TaxID=151549 RepID=A0A4C1Z613_EUMVA|nr:hypothetical protein EVAR_56884_1 [Eumeta japonica]
MLTDEFKDDRPKSVKVPENIDAVRELIMQDRHITYCKMKASLGINTTSIQKILHENLAVKGICSRWIPHDVSWCVLLLAKLHNAVLINGVEGVPDVQSNHQAVFLRATLPSGLCGCFLGRTYNQVDHVQGYSPVPMNTRNSEGVTNALSAPWKGIGHLIEEEVGRWKRQWTNRERVD